MDIVILSIVGRSKSGKTTLIERLIPELKKRGYRVGAIKHTLHGDFEIDYQGKDSWRMSHAGADTVVITSSEKMAMLKKLSDDEYNLDDIARWLFRDVDIIITEGYKRENKPKIEVNRKQISKELLCEKDELLAVVTDQELTLGVKSFGFDEISALTDFIIERLLRAR